MWSRYVGSASLAAFMTLGILFLMQYLVAQRDADGIDLPIVKIPDLPNILEDSATRPKEPPPDRIEIVIPPPTPIIDSLIDTTADPIQANIGPPQQTVPGEIKFRPGLADGGPVAVAKVSPIYPERARRQGLTGYAIVEFTVNTKGRVENARAVESSHPMFEGPCVQAVERFRYRPRVVNGQAVTVHGLQHRFSFTLED